MRRSRSSTGYQDASPRVPGARVVLENVLNRWVSVHCPFLGLWSVFAVVHLTLGLGEARLWPASALLRTVRFSGRKEMSPAWYLLMDHMRFALAMSIRIARQMLWVTPDPETLERGGERLAAVTWELHQDGDWYQPKGCGYDFGHSMQPLRELLVPPGRGVGS